MKKTAYNSGFTLIEAMIAVTILTLAVAGPMFTANRSIVAAKISRDQLTASYLAQEGVEYVRAMRDDGYLSAYQMNSATASGALGVGWANFLTSSISQCRGLNICTLDSSRVLTPCPGNSCTATFTLLSGGTPYKRTIQTASVANDEKIVSTVSWNFHGTPYSVTISDHLTPWQ